MAEETDYSPVMTKHLHKTTNKPDSVSRLLFVSDEEALQYGDNLGVLWKETFPTNTCPPTNHSLLVEELRKVHPRGNLNKNDELFRVVNKKRKMEECFQNLNNEIVDLKNEISDLKKQNETQKNRIMKLEGDARILKQEANESLADDIERRMITLAEEKTKMTREENTKLKTSFNDNLNLLVKGRNLTPYDFEMLDQFKEYFPLKRYGLMQSMSDEDFVKQVCSLFKSLEDQSLQN